MKVRFPLYAQTLCILCMHLLLVGSIFLILFNSQLGLGWDALLQSPVGTRVDAIAWNMRRQTEGHPIKSWTPILNDFGKLYGAKFYIFDDHGKQLAGEPIKLPADVFTRITTHRLHGAGFAERQAVALETEMQAASMNSSHPTHHSRRFLLTTDNPRTFWIGTRFYMFSTDQGLERLGEGPVRPGTLLAVCANPMQTSLLLDFGLLISVGLGILTLSILMWWPFAFRITRALGRLTAATEKIAEGRFDTRTKANRWDEIGSLGQAVNSMADRLNTYVTSQKRFLGDIAHELCSPISRLQMALALLESTATAEQESSLKDIREEVQEMSALINELLAFSKASLRGKDMPLAAVDVNAVLTRTVAKVGTDGNIKLDAQRDLFALADELLLERAISNILRNAVRYAGQSGPIQVKAEMVGQEIKITTSDSGPGVPPESIKLLGEPFYRPESSRSRSAGGVGLGLAIVKTCVESCEGLFEVRNRQPHGLEATIRLKACPTGDPAKLVVRESGVKT